MEKIGKDLCKIGGTALVIGAGVSLGYTITKRLMEKIQFKRDLKKINKLLDKIEKKVKPNKKKKFGKR